MEKYRIAFKNSVAKDLRFIPKNGIKNILVRIDTLAENPRGEGCIKLSGKENYRVRQGLYRIVYEIKDNVLVFIVVKVVHSSKVYNNN
jgi:mRNA interferase RelE/StbE